MKLEPSLAVHLTETDRALVGMWLCSGSPLVAEILAGSGLDWILLDGEHSPNGLESILAQLQAMHGYSVSPLVRVPVGDTVLIKQYLDLGVQNLLVPMVDTAEQARSVVAATRYPPLGVRGVGSALARASRWNRVPDYLGTADQTTALFVQIESAQAVDNVADIVETDGIDGIFIGPSDLAASMGLLGQQEHPDVVAKALHCIAAAVDAGTPAGINAFSSPMIDLYRDAGARFVAVGADVSVLARSSEQLAATLIAGKDESTRASY